MTFLRLEITTHIERNHAITLISQAIKSTGGWIVNHKLFSNTLASISFEIPSSQITYFIESLKVAGFEADVVGDLPASPKGEVSGILSINFVHSEPDMKRDIPAFD
jgi:hypothetical protein